MRKQKSMKKMMGLLCTGVLALSLPACGSVSAQEMQNQPLSAVVPVQTPAETEIGRASCRERVSMFV